MTCGGAFFQDAEVVHEGTTYRVTGAELDAALPGRHARSPGDPDTWLCARVYAQVKHRVAALPTEVLLELAARALGVTAASLRSSIEWHEQYMRWHDGDDEYRVL